MTDQPATLSQDGDVSIITLDDGKANVFSKNMSDTLESLLDQVNEQEKLEEPNKEDEIS